MSESFRKRDEENVDKVRIKGIKGIDKGRWGIRECEVGSNNIQYI